MYSCHEVNPASTCLHRFSEYKLERIYGVAAACDAPITGTVYFIRNETTLAVKVGFTTGDPRIRLATFQTAHEHELRLFGWMPGSMELEAALHAEFSTQRIRGEWFDIETPDWIIYGDRVLDDWRWSDLPTALPRIRNIAGKWYRDVRIEIDENGSCYGADFGLSVCVGDVRVDVLPNAGDVRMDIADAYSKKVREAEAKGVE